MKIEPKNNCPLNNFEPCKQLDCAWFIEIHGTHPNTGEPVKDWGCTMVMMPMMLLENAKQQHSTSAAVESFRNEMVKSNETSQKVLLAAANIPQQMHTLILENDQ
jgi:hypothetical protein